MKTQTQIIKNAVNGIFMRSIMSKKGWDKQQATEKVVAWLNCGKDISFHTYMVEA